MVEISNTLIAWYREHKRELPWRDVSDPYLIWISEIILQQTRVAQGLDYFLRFTRRFPDIRSLAEADEDEALRYWQGLGYYSRARHLHAAARTLMERFGGHFPSDYHDILSLPGIGEYTAAAITSFAWNQPQPVVDGNVFRLLARLFAIDTPIDSSQGKKEIAALAASLINPRKAGLHNQAIMEFGALHCVPQNPDCPHCPLQDKCRSYALGTPGAYPVKQHKTRTRPRYFHYLHILCGETTWLHRRQEKDIWNGLYEFPLIETPGPADFAELQATEAFRHLLAGAGRTAVAIALPGIKHVLSHQVLHATFYRIEIETPTEALQSYLTVSAGALDNYALPRLIQIYMEQSSPPQHTDRRQRCGQTVDNVVDRS
ncbi:MAG: A/G-specific adenine glycosylase [Tannerellaceae bacterium]|jgi:A/G-specific adenine glycosylase|nr:A/G-specific adenine glycosylase [Tannerellaceae bacterium]